MAVFLAWRFAFVMAALGAVDEPSRSLAVALTPAIALGVALHAGLFWAPSTRGFSRFIAGAMMVPGALLLLASAREELGLIRTGSMHDPVVAFEHLAGAAVYAYQLARLMWRRPREDAARAARLHLG